MEVQTFLYISIAVGMLGLLQGFLVMRNSYTLGSEDFASFIGSASFLWCAYALYYAIFDAPSIWISLYAASGMVGAVAIVFYVLANFKKLSVERVGDSRFRFPKKFVWFGQVVPGAGFVWGVLLLISTPNH